MARTPGSLTFPATIPDSARRRLDAVAGVQAGRAGGFAWVVGVARQGGGQALLDNGADVVVQRLDELDREAGGA